MIPSSSSQSLSSSPVTHTQPTLDTNLNQPTDPPQRVNLPSSYNALVTPTKTSPHLHPSSHFHSFTKHHGHHNDTHNNNYHYRSTPTPTPTSSTKLHLVPDQDLQNPTTTSLSSRVFDGEDSDTAEVEGGESEEEEVQWVECVEFGDGSRKGEGEGEEGGEEESGTGAGGRLGGFKGTGERGTEGERVGSKPISLVQGKKPISQREDVGLFQHTSTKYSADRRVGETPPPHTPHRAKNTPLKARFLREVTMSPQSRPQTPVKMGTPRRDGRMSPAKLGKSPDKGKENNDGGESDRSADRQSPTKHHLEVGQNGFYYSCEIPMSKIVPKKDAETPKKKKMEMNGTPKKNDIDTPRKNGINTSKTNNANTPNKPNPATSPAKLRGPGTPIRQRMPHLLDSVKKTDSNKKIKSGTPGSRDIGDMMAGLNFRKVASDASPSIPVGEGKVSAPPTPLRRAAERSGISSSVQARLVRLQGCDDRKSEEITLPAHSDGLKGKVPLSGQQQTSDVIAASPSPTVEAARAVGTQANSTPSVHRSSRRTLKRVGTDPAVLLAMRDEMSQMESRMRGSLSMGNEDSSIRMTTSTVESTNLKNGTDHSPKRTVVSSSTSRIVAISEIPSTPLAKKAQSRPESTKQLGPTLRSMPRQPLKTSYTHLRTPPPRPRNPTPLSTPARNAREAVTVTTPVPKSTPSTPRLVKTPASIPAYMRPTLASSAAVNEAVHDNASPRTPKTPKSATKPTPKPTTKSTKPPSTLPRPRNSANEMLPQKKEFVGATEIAARLRKWHNEDHNRDTIGSPLARQVGKSPKTGTKPVSKTTKSPLRPKPIPSRPPPSRPVTSNPSSHTPPGSPPKSSNLLPHTTTKPLFPSPPHTHNPKPEPTKKLIAPHTPVPARQASKIARLDRNAFRTPSKEIEGSLGEAIDRKIEEDRRSGMW